MNVFEVTAIVVAALVSSEILTLAVLVYLAAKLGLHVLVAAEAEMNAYGKKYF